MRTYLDTNVVIAYIDEGEPLHEEVSRAIDGVRDRVVSRLVLLELSTVYSRAGFGDSTSLAFYSIELIGAELIETDFNNVIGYALRLSPIIRLKTLDLLHISFCLQNNIGRLLTLDKDILDKRDAVKRLGLEVISPIQL